MRDRIESLFTTLKVEPVPARPWDVKKIRGEGETYRVRVSSHRFIYRVLWAQMCIDVIRIVRRSDNTYDF